MASFRVSDNKRYFYVFPAAVSELFKSIERRRSEFTRLKLQCSVLSRETKVIKYLLRATSEEFKLSESSEYSNIRRDSQRYPNIELRPEFGIEFANPVSDSAAA